MAFADGALRLLGVGGDAVPRPVRTALAAVVVYMIASILVPVASLGLYAVLFLDRVESGTPVPLRILAVLVPTLVVFAFALWVMRCLARGERWARLVLAALAAGGLVAALLNAADHLAALPLRGAVYSGVLLLLTAVQAGALGTALALLFAPASNAHFR